MQKKNLTIFYTRGALYNIVLLFFVGGLTQTFLLEAGVPDQKVSLYVSVMQIAEVSAMVILSAYFERKKNLFRWYGVFHILLLPMALAMMAVSFFRQMNVDLRYTLMLAGGIITYMAIGLAGMLDYKLPYLIMDMQGYGSVTAVHSILTGIVTMVSSALISWAAGGGDYLSVVGLFVIPAAVMILICAVLVTRYRALDINDLGKERTGKRINLLTYKPFYLLALPNFLRGFATGTFNLFTTIGYHLGMLDKVTATVMVTIGNVVIFAVGLFYSRAAKLHKDTQILIIAGIMMILSMPLAFVSGNITVFLVIYGVAFFFKTIFECVSPVALVPVLDYEIVGQYSSWRVALYLLGVALSGTVTIPMVDRFGVVPTMLLSGACFVFSGVSYHVVIRALLKEKKAAAEGKISENQDFRKDSPEIIKKEETK